MQMEMNKFQEYLEDKTLTPETVKMANLIYEHLDVIKKLSASQGARSKKIVELAELHWDAISESLLPTANKPLTSTSTQQLKRLKELTVGPFRGFAEQEKLDLNNNRIFIYGPNGTGKTSFCEALEHALIGNVLELQNLRSKKNDDYLNNFYVKRHEHPKLKALDQNDKEIIVSASSQQYQFCFVEKNRIDNFARIATYTPDRQKGLISTLFGLDGFRDFVKGFNKNLENYLTLENKKQQELDEQEKQINLRIENLETEKSNLDKSLSEQSMLLRQVSEHYQKGFETDEVEKFLTTLVQSNSTEPISQLTGITQLSFENAETEVNLAEQELKAKIREIGTYGDERFFKDLYEVINQLENDEVNSCPACKTPLESTLENPFHRAKSELAKLAELNRLTQERKELHKKYLQKLQQVSQLLLKFKDSLQYLENDYTSLISQLSSYVNIDDNGWKNLNKLSENKLSIWSKVKTICLDFQNYGECPENGVNSFSS